MPKVPNVVRLKMIDVLREHRDAIYKDSGGRVVYAHEVEVIDAINDAIAALEAEEAEEDSATLSNREIHSEISKIEAEYFNSLKKFTDRQKFMARLVGQVRSWRTRYEEKIRLIEAMQTAERDKPKLGMPKPHWSSLGLDIVWWMVSPDNVIFISMDDTEMGKPFVAYSQAYWINAVPLFDPSTGEPVRTFLPIGIDWRETLQRRPE